jgi:hypothetical protein
LGHHIIAGARHADTPVETGTGAVLRFSDTQPPRRHPRQSADERLLALRRAAARQSPQARVAGVARTVCCNGARAVASGSGA